MKIQDISFVIILAVLLFIRKPKLLVMAGLAALFLSIPLFAKWIFFTAQHLVYYAFAFFLIAVLLNLKAIRDNKSSTFHQKRNPDSPEKRNLRKVLDK